MIKRNINDLAFFGGLKAFSEVRSTSNLVQPDLQNFLNYTKRIYKSRWLTNNGPLVRELEARLSAIHGTRHCVTFCSGFMALMLAMYDMHSKRRIKEGDAEVVMPSLTYRRMADIAVWAGLVPRFCDIDITTLGITAKTVEPCLNEKTALILGVHPIVNLCDINGLEELSLKYKMPLLFDSVEASLASYKNRMVGSFGQAEVFSLHASKLLNGFEGGYLTTNDSELAEGLRKGRSFGFAGKDNIVRLGLNAKLNEVHAAMTLACLDEIDSQISRNKIRYSTYKDRLADIEGIDIIPYDERETRSYKNILVRLDDSWPLSRECTLQILHAENLLARPYYYPSLHKKDTPYKQYTGNNLHVTEGLSLNHMLLPCGEFVNLEDIHLIADLLIFLQKHGSEIQKRVVSEAVR
jgi:dTDP-4-amino-4,6-dideoxygalactose transaminase